MAEDAPEPDPPRRDGAIALALTALVVATVAFGALVPGRPSRPPPLASLPENDPACAEWSDGCRVCQRREDGPACSLPGIACTPHVQTCLRAIR